MTSAVEYLQSQGIDKNPVEMLRYLQKVLVKGRPLEIQDITERLEGETSVIFVDREKVIETGLEEIRRIEDKRLTLEVQFYGEVSLASTVLTTVFRILYSDHNTLLQFYELLNFSFFTPQQASDYGGPRKEFFNLILHEIHEKFFIDGLRDFRYLDEDYQAIGVVMGNTVYK